MSILLTALGYSGYSPDAECGRPHQAKVSARHDMCGPRAAGSGRCLGPWSLPSRETRLAKACSCEMRDLQRTFTVERVERAVASHRGQPLWLFHHPEFVMSRRRSIRRCRIPWE